MSPQRLRTCAHASSTRARDGWLVECELKFAFAGEGAFEMSTRPRREKSAKKCMAEEEDDPLWDELDGGGSSSSGGKRVAKKAKRGTVVAPFLH